MSTGIHSLRDPFAMAKWLWPDVVFYRKQREIIRSYMEDDETFVVAGNMLGKDFVAGFVCVHAFLTNLVARIVTTSVKDDHLRVLWGEMLRFIQTSKVPLTVDKGGPLIVNHRDIRKMYNGVVCPISYIRGMVAANASAMSGHHAPFAMGVIDEASGVDDVIYGHMDEWAKKKLIFGNPHPTRNFFYRAVKGGNVEAA